MSDFVAHERRLKIRALLSIVLFAIFTALALAAAISMNESLKYVVLVPFALSLFALPRRVILPTDDKETAKSYQKIQLWFSYIRVAYFLIACALLFVVPRFV